jgi:hypothetical protein
MMPSSQFSEIMKNDRPKLPINQTGSQSGGCTLFARMVRDSPGSQQSRIESNFTESISGSNKNDWKTQAGVDGGYRKGYR